MECSQVFLNIFRVLLLKGLTRMLWTQLNSGYFTFLGTCTYDRADDKGRPLPDGTATYVREDLADRLHNLTSSMRMWGALFLLLAIVTQVRPSPSLEPASDALRTNAFVKWKHR